MTPQFPTSEYPFYLRTTRNTLVNFLVLLPILLLVLLSNNASAQEFEECAELYKENGAIPGDANCKVLASTVRSQWQSDNITCLSVRI